MFLQNILFFYIVRTCTSLLVKLKCIIKETLSHKTTWNCWILPIHSYPIQIDLLMWIKILNPYDWGTGTLELFNCLVVSSQLFVITRLHISSMILVEIIHLIVNIDWPSKTRFRDVFQIYPASIYIWISWGLRIINFILHAFFIVPLFDFNNLATQH